MNAFKRCWRGWRFQRTFGLSRSRVERLFLDQQLPDWHFREMDEFRFRLLKQLCLRWILQDVPASARLHEAGCGIGTNLFYLRRHGFHNLSGSDSDAALLAGARTLGEWQGAPLATHQRDDLEFVSPEPLDALVSLNWAYLQTNFDLGDWLLRARAALRTGGLLFFDVMDKNFEADPRAAFNSNDWGRAPDERRASQYLWRHSPAEVRECARRANFKVVREAPVPTRFPRWLFLLEAS